MVTTPPRYESDLRGDLEFLLGQIEPLLATLRSARAEVARLARVEGAEEEVLVRLLDARRRLQASIGELVLEHVDAGGSVRLE